MLAQSATAATNSDAVVGFLAQTTSAHSLFTFAKVLAFALLNRTCSAESSLDKVLT